MRLRLGGVIGWELLYTFETCWMLRFGQVWNGLSGEKEKERLSGEEFEQNDESFGFISFHLFS